MISVYLLRIVRETRAVYEYAVYVYEACMRDSIEIHFNKKSMEK